MEAEPLHHSRPIRYLEESQPPPPARWPAARVGLVVFSIITALGACVAAYILLAHFGPASFVKHLPLQQIAASQAALYCLPILALPIAGIIITALKWRNHQSAPEGRLPVHVPSNFVSMFPTPVPEIEQRTVINGHHNPVNVAYTSLTLDGEAEQLKVDYAFFLTADSEGNKRTLMLETAGKQIPAPSTTLSFERVLDSPHPDDVLLKMSPRSEPARVWDNSPNRFTYQPTDRRWVDCYPIYGNRSFGGGALRRGLTQEEVLFLHCPEFYQLLYGMRGALEDISPQDHEGNPTPLIFRDRAIQYNVNAYGSVEQLPPGEIAALVQPVENAGLVTFFDIAALDYRRRPNAKYTGKDLFYHYKAAYLAFTGIKAGLQPGQRPLIHMSDWGCGAFRGSVATMLPLILMAARVADVDITFEGVRGQRLSADETVTAARDLSDNCSSALQLIEELLEEQAKDKDSAYRPQTQTQ